MRILVVEDEKRLSEALKQLFEDNKIIVDVVEDGNSAVYYASSAKYDVIVLDIMIPGIDGFKVAKELRKSKNSTPILMLTAKSDISDKVTGLNCGADDYMTKPFSTDELMARVNALSRRKGEVITDALEFADLTLSLTNISIATSKKTLPLNRKEFEVMKMLMMNTNNVISKEQFIVNVWGSDSDVDDNNVEAYISFLRKKLLHIESKATIKAYRKIGYMLKVNNDE